MKKATLVLPCLRAVIGDWVYYSSVMTAPQIAAWVLPVKDIRESRTLDEYLQRDLRDERKTRISNYLLHDKTRFFNSLIIGIFGEVPEWISLSYMSEEYKGRKIMDEDDIKYVSESSGLMFFSGSEKMFALDGQHRVEGIKLALAKDQSKKTGNEVLVDDQYSVIFVGHLDDDLGRKRSRKLFSDINKNAKPVGRGDRIKIDEQDINAIVSRRIFANCKYFKDSNLIALTETSNLDKNDTTHFANLATLDTVCKKLKKLFKKESKIPEWEEANVLKFYKIVLGFYEFVFTNISEYNEFFITKKLTLAKARKNNHYFLFRPIGLIMLAKLYVHFYNDLTFFKKNIKKINFIMPHGPLNNVIWSSGKMEAKAANQTLGFDLVLYLLNKYSASLPDLKKRYQEIVKNPEAKLPLKVV